VTRLVAAMLVVAAGCAAGPAAAFYGPLAWPPVAVAGLAASWCAVRLILPLDHTWPYDGRRAMMNTDPQATTDQDASTQEAPQERALRRIRTLSGRWLRPGEPSIKEEVLGHQAALEARLAADRSARDARRAKAAEWKPGDPVTLCICGEEWPKHLTKKGTLRKHLAGEHRETAAAPIERRARRRMRRNVVGGMEKSSGAARRKAPASFLTHVVVKVRGKNIRMTDAEYRALVASQREDLA